MNCHGLRANKRSEGVARVQYCRLKTKGTCMSRILTNLLLATIPALLAIWPTDLSMGHEGAASGWRQAVAPRLWSFPKDHGSHPEYRTEWWYFTGNLRDADGARYGYQLTFFRQGVRLRPEDPDNPWSLRDAYLAHFAIADLSTGSFQSADLVSRAGPGLAGASTDAMHVWLLDWSARMEGSTVFLKARNKDMALELTLRPRKPLVLHGCNGLSKKAAAAGQASYYYSFTRLDTTGEIRTSPQGLHAAVKGVSWFDHEFGSNQLTPDQEGWDWFSLHLSDGKDLMIYFLRRKDGSIEPESSGTLVNLEGIPRHLKLSDVNVSILGRWQSPKTGTRYPCRWRIRIPSAGLDLNVAPLLAEQELDTRKSTGVIYWEGAVAGKGTSSGQRVSCEGYIELTGYGEGIGGMF